MEKERSQSEQEAEQDASRYHHGDLQNALLEACTRLAVADGPEAVGVRRAARITGVTPAAAYRHFASREVLLASVATRCRSKLAEAVLDVVEPRFESTLSELGKPGTDPLGIVRLGAKAYLEAAIAEPGLYTTAQRTLGRSIFDSDHPIHQVTRRPLQLLTSHLDALVGAGILRKSYRPDAEFVVWTAIQGMASTMVTVMTVPEHPQVTAVDVRNYNRLVDKVFDCLSRGLGLVTDPTLAH